MKPFKFMEGVSKHKRSNSDPVKRKVGKDKLNSIILAPYRLGNREMGRPNSCVEEQPNCSDVQGSLNQEILQLQKQLQDQLVARHAFEKALSYQHLSYDTTIEDSLPKSAKDLIKDITVLELEVVFLERHLLSLYRKTFDQCIPSELTVAERQSSSSVTHEGSYKEFSGQDVTPESNKTITYADDLTLPRSTSGKPFKECNGIWEPEKLLDLSIHRCYSSLSQRSTCSPKTSPRTKCQTKNVDSYHSLPFSMLEQAQFATSNLYAEEHLGSYFSDHVPETPNSLSEEMIKCISAIYCELADPPIINNGYTCSPITFSAPMHDFSSQAESEKWSSRRTKIPFFNSQSEKPIHFEGSEELSGPYCRMLKVQCISEDTEKLRDVDHTLKKFSSLVYQLEGVDLRKMKHEEKLAFWINVHNALVMHTFLTYGIPQNYSKRVSLPLKSAYNVGGHTISVDMIQRSILGCRLPRPGQWLRLLFTMKTKFKAGDARKSYAIEQPEPLLHFALCSGSYSDPAVRMYTSKRVFEELETAKEEYIQSTFLLHKEQKILLPKIVESFAKDSGLCSAGLVEMIERLLPNSERKSNPQCQQRRIWKAIDWIPHNFTFRYLIPKEVAW
ncbi:putative ternary complex factor MIP1, leucine-zipper [Rosa chinensis]|uniref:Putative ternary complex factor MIP1, leucine-zipper n=2 Tax=Rosa chinensis TaxID=74649 RepID=A0A2P6PNN1_ROSCH|nr:uncharacterized protein LOC112169144 isoform X1 [Rosa chinensis]PRQ23516.1 putative ternary complex factor MIP1, leucine-zipper [Rosa chinensis]